MFFLQATQAPVLATLGATTLSIPKMDMDDLIAWANEYHHQHIEELTADLDEARAREFKMYYAPIEPQIDELAKLVRTATGIKKIFETCLPKATVKSGPKLDFSPEQVTALIKANGIGRLFPLAWELADLQDKSAVDPNPPKGPPAGKEGENPLTPTAKPA